MAWGARTAALITATAKVVAVVAAASVGNTAATPRGPPQRGVADEGETDEQSDDKKYAGDVFRGAGGSRVYHWQGRVELDRELARL